MNTLTVSQTNADALAVPGADLQAKLLALAKHGRPRLSLIDNGWYCVVEMYNSVAGAEFRVCSDFMQPTPAAAVDQVAARIRAAVSTYGGATP